MANGESRSGGITFIGALQVLFIGLKLAGFIDWPWWVVLLPIEVDLVIVGFCFLLMGFIAWLEYRR